MNLVIKAAYVLFFVSLTIAIIVVVTYTRRFKIGRDVEVQDDIKQDKDDVREQYDQTHNITKKIVYDKNEYFDWKLYENQDKERIRKFFGVYHYSTTESVLNRIKELKKMKDERSVKLFFIEIFFFVNQFDQNIFINDEGKILLEKKYFDFIVSKIEFTDKIVKAVNTFEDIFIRKNTITLRAKDIFAFLKENKSLFSLYKNGEFAYEIDFMHSSEVINDVSYIDVKIISKDEAKEVEQRHSNDLIYEDNILKPKEDDTPEKYDYRKNFDAYYINDDGYLVLVKDGIKIIRKSYWDFDVVLPKKKKKEGEAEKEQSIKERVDQIVSGGAEDETDEENETEETGEAEETDGTNNTDTSKDNAVTSNTTTSDTQTNTDTTSKSNQPNTQKQMSKQDKLHNAIGNALEVGDVNEAFMNVGTENEEESTSVKKEKSIIRKSKGAKVCHFVSVKNANKSYVAIDIYQYFKSAKTMAQFKEMLSALSVKGILIIATAMFDPSVAKVKVSPDISVPLFFTIDDELFISYEYIEYFFLNLLNDDDEIKKKIAGRDNLLVNTFPLQLATVFNQMFLTMIGQPFFKSLSKEAPGKMYTVGIENTVVKFYLVQPTSSVIKYLYENKSFEPMELETSKKSIKFAVRLPNIAGRR